jgi:hypothetical protein
MLIKADCSGASEQLERLVEKEENTAALTA